MMSMFTLFTLDFNTFPTLNIWGLLAAPANLSCTPNNYPFDPNQFLPVKPSLSPPTNPSASPPPSAKPSSSTPSVFLTPKPTPPLPSPPASPSPSSPLPHAPPVKASPSASPPPPTSPPSPWASPNPPPAQPPSSPSSSTLPSTPSSATSMKTTWPSTSIMPPPLCPSTPSPAALTSRVANSSLHGWSHAIKMVRVWLAYSSTRPSTPILVSQIDLFETFEDFMHVGFTASNGEGSSDYTGKYQKRNS
ncbi:hypothetical protein DEO72_LG9g853 [Vigna unguiculata]|uniref:Uncharacterized protein n=1 Tax=Vigna unguiculata TaxID=3917 RepID=A0A4D6N187_VIGUN|nr:hypothetical protein DEO72_LG9g853 [Vigna unguiculata]